MTKTIELIREIRNTAEGCDDNPTPDDIDVILMKLDQLETLVDQQDHEYKDLREANMQCEASLADCWGE